MYYRLIKFVKSLPIESLAFIPVCCYGCSFSCPRKVNSLHRSQILLEDGHALVHGRQAASLLMLAAVPVPHNPATRVQHRAWAVEPGYNAMLKATPYCLTRRQTVHSLDLPEDPLQSSLSEGGKEGLFCSTAECRAVLPFVSARSGCHR